MLSRLSITFIAFIGLFACHENGQNTDSDSVAIRKITDVPMDSVSHQGTTLDSLQGKWISNMDANDFLLIQAHRRTETYKDGNKIDSNIAEFYLADSCETSVRNLDIRKTSGQCMIMTLESDTSNVLCYQIDYIDDKHLVLLSHGKTLGYDKK